MSISSGWYFLLTAVVLIGTQATMAQVILVRELLVVFYGNELCLGVILGTWLFGVALGAGLGAKVLSGCQNKQTIFLFLLLALCLMLPGQVVAIRLLRFIIHVPYGQHISILSLLLTTPPSRLPRDSRIYTAPMSVAAPLVKPLKTWAEKGNIKPTTKLKGMIMRGEDKSRDSMDMCCP